jgi:hypothetical protein
VMHNEAIRQYNEHVFAVAARPLAVLGAAHRISSDRSSSAVRSPSPTKAIQCGLAGWKCQAYTLWPAG